MLNYWIDELQYTNFRVLRSYSFSSFSLRYPEFSLWLHTLSSFRYSSIHLEFSSDVVGW